MCCASTCLAHHSPTCVARHSPTCLVHHSPTCLAHLAFTAPDLSHPPLDVCICTICTCLAIPNPAVPCNTLFTAIRVTHHSPLFVCACKHDCGYMYRARHLCFKVGSADKPQIASNAAALSTLLSQALSRVKVDGAIRCWRTHSRCSPAVAQLHLL